jgi:hypothetical protein
VVLLTDNSEAVQRTSIFCGVVIVGIGCRTKVEIKDDRNVEQISKAVPLQIVDSTTYRPLNSASIRRLYNLSTIELGNYIGAFAID